MLFVRRSVNQKKNRSPCNLDFLRNCQHYATFLWRSFALILCIRYVDRLFHLYGYWLYAHTALLSHNFQSNPTQCVALLSEARNFHPVPHALSIHEDDLMNKNVDEIESARIRVNIIRPLVDSYRANFRFRISTKSFFMSSNTAWVFSTARGRCCPNPKRHRANQRLSHYFHQINVTAISDIITPSAAMHHIHTNIF